VTRFLPRFLVPLVWLLASSANAQSPSPAQVGITHSTLPEVLQVLDHTGTWAPIGAIDPTTHQYMLPIVNGGTGTSSPSLTAGPGVTVTGAWPNQTIGAAGGGSGSGVPAGAVGDFQTNAGLGSFGNVPPPLPSSMGGEADIVVTDPTVGMAAATSTSVTDNSQFLQNLMNKMGPPNPYISGYNVTIPHFAGQNYTEYYNTQPWVLTRGANYRCSGTALNSGTYLIFAPGIDGVIQESYNLTVPGSTTGGAGKGMLSGCSLMSMGYGSATANPVVNPNVLTGVSFAGDPAGLIPKPTWGVGDGIFLTAALNGFFPSEAIPAAPIGTTVTAIDGATGNLTLSNPVSSFLGPRGDPSSTAVFTETGSNNFGNLDTVTVGNPANSTTYTFRTILGTVSNSVLVGKDFPTSAANLVAAVMGTAGQYATYVPASASSPAGLGANLDLTAAYASGAITFTSRYSGPAVNTFVSTASSAAGTFGGPTFSGANDATTCPSPCTAQNVSTQFFQLPLSQAFQVQTTIGSNTAIAISGPRLLKPDDVVLSDAFPYGSTIFSATTSFPQTLKVNTPTVVSNAQNATVTHAPGAEGSLWIMPALLKRRAVASAENNHFSNSPIGLQMACTAVAGVICNGAHDRGNWYQQVGVGRWVAGNNTSADSSIDEVFANNFITDIFEGGTLGEVYNNPNSNSVESGSAKWAFIMNCANQNWSVIFGGYTFMTTGNGCSNQTSVYPPTPGGPLFIGPQSGYTNGPTLAVNTFRGLSSSWNFLGGQDGTKCVGLGGPPNSWYFFAFGLNGCATNATFGIGFNALLNSFDLNYAAGTVPFMRFFNVSSIGYTGYGGVGTGIAFPQAVILGSDGNSLAQNLRQFGMSSVKPVATFHLQGDFTTNTLATPGGQGAWAYAPVFSTTLTAAVAKGQPTSTPISVAACPTVAPPAGTLVSDQSASLIPNVNLCVFSSCAANQITCTAATLNASAAANDAIKLLYPYGAAPVSNDPANPDYTATTIRTGSAANKDLTGRIALAAGAASYTLIGGYGSAPNCFCADVTTPANLCSVAESTTALAFTGTGTDTVKWHCDGRN
jgi:hypothetical protein